MARRGRRGEGTVYWSKRDRRWIARVPLGTVDGVRQEKREKHRTEDEARDALKRLRRVYAPGRTTDTLDAWLDEWLPAHAASVRASTATSYRGHVKHHIRPLLGGIPLAELTPSDVRRLIAELERKPKRPTRKGERPEDVPRISSQTTRLVVRTLSAALNAAVRDGLVTRNVTAGVRLPRADHEPIVPMRPEAAEAIIEAVAGTWIERPVRVLLGSGMRLGEVMGLDQGDVLSGYVRVRRSKTTVRAVPVSEDAQDALAESIRQAPRVGVNEPVFFAPGGTGRMLGPSVSHALPRILVAAGLPRLTPHALRHGVATLMLADGTSMRTISEQLGHRNPAITARVYAHVLPEAQVRALASLPKRREAR
jgi:integrase